jgi:hypothetical protein
MGNPLEISSKIIYFCAKILTWDFPSKEQEFQSSVSRFSDMLLPFLSWGADVSSGWSVAVMVFRGQDCFENILLMNDRFHKVTEYVKRFSVVA